MILFLRQLKIVERRLKAVCLELLTATYIADDMIINVPRRERNVGVV